MATKIDQIGYNTRDELIKELGLRLADGMVDVELDRDHYDIAINNKNRYLKPWASKHFF